MRWIDPPSGSKYGFPKPFDPSPRQRVDAWLLENGYPQSEIDQWRGKGVPCRVWGEPEEDPVRLIEVKIWGQIRHIVGDQARAEAWYRSEPIPALGGRTAEEVVKSGDGEAVLAFLKHWSRGGFP